jgi:succinyl-diaminopimelate desuccinylase
MMNVQDIMHRINARIEAFEEEMIRLQIELTAIPAISPYNGGEGEISKAVFLSGKLKEFGFKDLIRIDAPDTRVPSAIRPNIILRIPGKNESTTWIMTHLDIVPPGELGLWNGNPYHGYVKDGMIFGRGVVDNQQDMVASIFAARAIMEEGITTDKSIGLAFVADEETSSEYGLGHILSSNLNPFGKDDIIVVPDSGNEEGSLIEVTEKSILWLRIRTKGKQCHASRPQEGINAFKASSHMVVKLNELGSIFNAVDEFFDPPHSTFQPTKKESNVPNINTIPGEDVFFMDCRVLPQYSLTEVIKTFRNFADGIEKQFNVDIELTPVQYVQSPQPTSPNAPVVLALQKAIKDVYNVNAKPQGIGAGTVAALFRKAGYPAAVWSKLLQTAHQPDEHCVINDLIGNAKVYAHLFLQK